MSHIKVTAYCLELIIPIIALLVTSMDLIFSCLELTVTYT